MVDDRLRALLIGEAMQDLEAQLLVGTKRAEHAHLGGLRAHVARSHREPPLPDDRVAEGEMVAEEPPRPRVLEARAAEEADVVEVLRPKVTGRHTEAVDLELAQDVLHRHDLERLRVAAHAECGLQQRLDQSALVEVQLEHRDAGAIRLRDEVPVETTRIIHREFTRPPLLVRQRVQKRLAEKHHPADGLWRLIRRVHQTIPL